jgi:hypothetical protein
MEGSNGNENTIIRNEGCEMFLNEANCEKEIMEETQKNEGLQTKENKNIWENQILGIIEIF